MAEFELPPITVRAEFTVDVTPEAVIALIRGLSSSEMMQETDIPPEAKLQ